jgi:hypothetical protein
LQNVLLIVVAVLLLSLINRERYSDNVISGATGKSSRPYFIDFATYEDKQPFDIRFNPGVLPKNTHIRIYFPTFKTSLPLKKSLQGISVVKGRGIRIPERPEEQCDMPTKYNTNSTFIIDVDKVRQREPAIVHDRYGIFQ